MNHADSVLGWRLVRPLAPRNGCEEWIGVADLEAPKVGSEHWQGFAVSPQAQSMERRRIVIAEGAVAVELMRELELRERMHSDFIERPVEFGFFERTTAAAVFTMTEVQPLGRFLADGNWSRGAAVSLLAPLAEVIETAHELLVTGISVEVAAIEVDAQGRPRVAGLFGAQQRDPAAHRAKWDLACAEDALTLGITAAAVLARVREGETDGLEGFAPLDALVTAMVERRASRDAVVRFGELLFDFAVPEPLPEPLPQLPSHQPTGPGPSPLREAWAQANVWQGGAFEERTGVAAQEGFLSESLLDDDITLGEEPHSVSIGLGRRTARRLRVPAITFLRRAASSSRAAVPKPALPKPALPTTAYPKPSFSKTAFPSGSPSRAEPLLRWCAQVRPIIWLGLAGTGCGCVAVGALGLAGASGW